MSATRAERLPPGEERSRAPVVVWTIIGAALILLAIAVVFGSGLGLAVIPLSLVVVIAATHERSLAWPSLLGFLILVILFVPIKRYTLPSALPFNLELYRLVVAAIFLAWFTSLLIDSRVRLRASGLEAPLFMYLLAVMFSLFTNTDRVNAVGSEVVKSMTFFLSFVVLFYIVVSLARSARHLDFLVRILVGGGAVLALAAIIESRTYYNVFNHLTSVFPFMKYDATLAPQVERGGRLRVYASAQHPIAIGTALAMLLPLAVYRAKAFRDRRWWWWAAFVLLLFGVLAARSRTGIVMLIVMGIVYLVLRPRDMRRLWPAVLPALIAIHVILPGALGTVKGSFFPSGGIVAEQRNAGEGHARLSTLGPALHKEFVPNPVLGEGFATRVPQPTESVSEPNAPITDNQWLVVVLETGVVGTFAFGWLLLRSFRRMLSAAKRDMSPRGWLLAGTAASVAAYGVSMFTYDAFSFIQTTFLLFIVLAIGSAALQSPPSEWERLRDQADGDGTRVPATARGR